MIHHPSTRRSGCGQKRFHCSTATVYSSFGRIQVFSCLLTASHYRPVPHWPKKKRRNELRQEPVHVRAWAQELRRHRACPFLPLSLPLFLPVCSLLGRLLRAQVVDPPDIRNHHAPALRLDRSINNHGHEYAFVGAKRGGVKRRFCLAASDHGPRPPTQAPSRPVKAGSIRSLFSPSWLLHNSCSLSYSFRRPFGKAWVITCPSFTVSTIS